MRKKECNKGDRGRRQRGRKREEAARNIEGKETMEKEEGSSEGERGRRQQGREEGKKNGR